MAKVICLYHANCLDGFGSAAIVRSKHINAKLIPVHYGREIPNVSYKGATVFIVDFSYDIASMNDILARGACSITVIDHHETAGYLNEYVGLDPRISLYIETSNEKYSGVGLCWNYFYGDTCELPIALRAIQDRDIWKFKEAHTKEVCAALRLYEQDETLATHLVCNGPNFFNELVLKGSVLMQKFYKDLDVLYKQRCYINFTGYKVPAVNAPPMYASELGEMLAIGHAFSVVWSFNGKNFSCSLRSSPTGIDVSKVAKLVGGGGHKHAAGCSVNTYMFDPQ